MKSTVFEKVKEFKKKFPLTIAWRLKQNSKVIEQNINPDEEVLYAFVAQKTSFIWSTCAVALTNKRILIGQKRVLFGYFYYSITPDLYNDLQLRKGLIWGSVILDTVKELVTLSYIQPKGIIEIETKISEFMMESKKLYRKREKNEGYEN